jgi:hypothetical protein
LKKFPEVNQIVSEVRFYRTDMRTLGKIFESKREEDRSWRKLHNDELHNLYSSLNIVRVIKSRRMRWAGHAACMGRGEVFTGFWLGGLKVGDHWKD